MVIDLVPFVSLGNFLEKNFDDLEKMIKQPMSHHRLHRAKFQYHSVIGHFFVY
jgi:hypothetical protein